MATETVVEQTHEDPSAYAGVLRFYELAKRAEWQVRDLPWGEITPNPETKGTAEEQARRRDNWRSVITQHRQADEPAWEREAQRLKTGPADRAELYPWT